MQKLYRSFLLLTVAVLFSACGGESRQDPYLMGQTPAKKGKIYTVSTTPKSSEVTIATIEAETQKEIAKINKERDLELKKMEEKTKLVQLSTENEMAIKEHNLTTYVKENEFAFKNSTLVIIALSFFALLALTIYIFRKRREDKLKMHEDELQKEVYLREKELQVKMAEKILDTIASGKLSEEKEQHLLEALDKTTTPTLTHKK